MERTLWTLWRESIPAPQPVAPEVVPTPVADDSVVATEVKEEQPQIVLETQEIEEVVETNSQNNPPQNPYEEPVELHWDSKSVGELVDEELQKREQQKREEEFKNKIAGEVQEPAPISPIPSAVDVKSEEEIEAEAKKSLEKGEQLIDELIDDVEKENHKNTALKKLAKQKWDALRIELSESNLATTVAQNEVEIWKWKYNDVQRTLVDMQANAISNADPMVKYFNNLVRDVNEDVQWSKEKYDEFIFEQAAIKAWLSRNELRDALDNVKKLKKEKEASTIEALSRSPGKSSISPKMGKRVEHIEDKKVFPIAPTRF